MSARSLKWRRHALRLSLVVALLLADALLAQHAVAVNAAGALLSPGRAMPIEALTTALCVLASRVGWIVLLTSSAALLAADAVARIWARRPADAG